MAPRVDGDGKPRAGEDCGQHQRQDRQADVVVDPDAGIVGEHGDEVRRPYSAAAGRARGCEPPGPRAPARRGCAMQQIDRRKAGEKANDSGQTDQPQIVLAGQAREHSEHVATPEFSGIKLPSKILPPANVDTFLG